MDTIIGLAWLALFVYLLMGWAVGLGGGRSSGSPFDTKDPGEFDA
jgi:hypothetical protein